MALAQLACHLPVCPRHGQQSPPSRSPSSRAAGLLRRLMGKEVDRTPFPVCPRPVPQRLDFGAQQRLEKRGRRQGSRYSLSREAGGPPRTMGGAS